MKVKTLNNLQDLISEDLAWRKIEISYTKKMIQKASGSSKETALRAGVALLYAHWEGSIKNMSTYYLSYVSQLKLPYSQLKDNFLALDLKKKITEFNNNNKNEYHTQFIGELFSRKDKRSNIPIKSIINTESNLNSTVFINIMNIIGLSYKEYSLRFKLLDEVLLANRNSIAHGEKMSHTIDEDRYFELCDKVLELINKVSTQILNVAVQKDYIS